jgi:hypothetical protein
MSEFTNYSPCQVSDHSLGGNFSEKMDNTRQAKRHILFSVFSPKSIFILLVKESRWPASHNTITVQLTRDEAGINLEFLREILHWHWFHNSHIWQAYYRRSLSYCLLVKPRCNHRRIQRAPRMQPSRGLYSPSSLQVEPWALLDCACGTLPIVRDQPDRQRVPHSVMAFAVSSFLHQPFWHLPKHPVVNLMREIH